MRLVSDDERRARLGARHALAAQVASVRDAAEAVVCLHATEPASVHLAAWARSGASRAEVEHALYDARSVVRQLAMRRTLFGFPRDLLPAVWGSAGNRVAGPLRARLAREVESAGIARDGRRWVSRVCNAVVRSLHEDGPATTAELRSRVPGLDRRIEISPGKSYGGEFPLAPRILAAVAASGEILRGENRGDWRQSRPVWWPAEEWLGERPHRLPAERGYAELVRRWLSRFGPGTEDDLVWWLGATRGAVRAALADVGAVEVGLETGAGSGFVLPVDVDEPDPPAPWAALLPALDPTVMGWKMRDFYLGPHAGHLFDTNGNAGPTAWWDGRIVGGWTQDPDGVVEVVLLEDVGTEASRALGDRAERLTAWLGGDVVPTLYQSPLVRRRTATS